jgi:adenylate cyclase, class 2
MNGQETEVKFYVESLAKTEARLIELGAHLVQERVHETNLRFDTAGRSLRKEGKVLRLRHDHTVKMTFKSDTTKNDGILSRKEIEFEVESFEAARELIESLGYEIVLFYEKYRKTYDLNGLHIMLDELPYGDFVEVEGHDAASIREVTEKLGLRWSAAIPSSYGALFERVAKPRKLDASKLTFEAFSGQKPSLKELSVSAADQEEEQRR